MTLVHALSLPSLSDSEALEILKEDRINQAY